jgi:tRNA1Val (adenine37-N6)-methyltransferase
VLNDKQPQKFFKGWAVPGPVPPGEARTTRETGEATHGAWESLDALGGHYRIFQLRDGHRYSTDDLVVAWYATTICPSASRVLDLGSGLGSVAMLAAWRLQGVPFVTIEAQDESVALARKSVVFNGLDGRFDVRHGDFRTPELLMRDEEFDLITGSPPYFPLGTGLLGEHPQKVACRFETRGSIFDYCATAAPEHQEARVRDAAREAGLQIFRRRNVVLREGEPPLLGLFAMIRRGQLPETLASETDGLLWHEPDLVIRSKDGKVTPEYLSVKLAMGLPPTG